MTPFAGELVGTMTLIVLGGGVNAGVLLKSSKSQGAGWMVITFGWGLAVAMAIYAVGNISGAHINPAVTIALAAVGEFPWKDVPTYILAQMIGAILGAVIVYVHYLPHWKITEDKDLKLAVFSTGPAIRNVYANLLSEIIGTAVLILGILAIGAYKFTEGLNPFIIGMLILAIGISLGGTTGYAINPARDLGPRIAHFLLPIYGKRDSDWGYAWIPVVGPILGGLYGSLFYYAIYKQIIGLGFWVMNGLVAILIVMAFINSRKKKEE